MSYILEALKQSEQKRDNSDVPDLNAVQGVVPNQDTRAPLRRRALLGVLMTLVLLVGGIAGWWFGGTSTEEYLRDNKVTDKLDLETESAIPVSANDRSVDTVAAVEFLSEPLVPPAPLAPPKETEPELEAVVTKLREEPVVQESASPSVSETTLAQQNQKNLEALIEAIAKSGEESRQLESIGDNETENATTLTKAVESSSTAPEAIQEPSEDMPGVPADSAQVQVQVQAEAVQIVETPKPPHFRELPYEIQQKLPKISFSVHLYAPDSARRMVKINGLMKREGDQVVAGLILDEITPTGAVFTFEEYRFRVPVN